MAEGAADACICILFYGAEDKHFRLAQRVLNESMRRLAKRNIAFRFGCNAVGTDTTKFLLQQIADHFHGATLFHSQDNIMKYPMMRQIFHAPPIRAPLTIWFDHDSYLSDNLDVDDWLDRVAMHFTHCDMIGSVYKSRLADEQKSWVAKQSWFNAEKDRPYVSYALGGWWTIKTELLSEWNWPPVDFKQKNGDLILGSLFEHQNLKLCHFRDGVCINANDVGVEGTAPRTIT